MRLVDFLILLLEGHAETLKKLHLIIGEQKLIEILESSEEIESLRKEKVYIEELKNFISSLIQTNPHCRDFYPEQGDPYQKLEGAVRDFDLPPVLEFYLWAYEPYRVWIESSIDLNWKIPGSGENMGMKIVDLSLLIADTWIQSIQLPRELMFQVESMCKVPWIQFRTKALKQIGKRPLGPVY